MKRPRIVPALLVMGVAVAVSGAAQAEVYRCRIGKPSYCFKYGGNLCEKWNKRPDAPAACQKWTQACLTCHEQIPACLGRQSTPSSSPLCNRCSTAWLACMKKIDRRYWPNRSDGAGQR
jgi:hypothetical protein